MNLTVDYGNILNDMESLESGIIAPDFDVVVGELETALTHYGEFSSYVTELNSECALMDGLPTSDTDDEIAELAGLRFIMTSIDNVIANIEDKQVKVLAVDRVIPDRQIMLKVGAA